jgi:hypothetical protein
MATASPLNAQLSSSWTWFPADPATDNPFFQEFAAQGQNLFQASGDSSAWNSTSEIFPADDALLTSVGGTDLQTSSAGGPRSSETAWVDGGGGLSPDKFSIPSYQTATASGCSACSKPCATARTVRRMRILLFMSVPTKQPAPPMNSAEQRRSPPCNSHGASALPALAKQFQEPARHRILAGSCASSLGQITHITNPRP